MNAALRLALGVVFFVAGAAKAADPESVVLAVASYDLLPAEAAWVVGVALPGVELAVGAALLVRLHVRAAALAALGLALVFLAATSSALLRGIDTQCGCFGGASAIVNAGVWTAVLHVALVVAAARLLLHADRRRAAQPSARGAAHLPRGANPDCSGARPS